MSAIDDLAKVLREELADVLSGPMSDMGYVRAEVNEDGDLELFDDHDESSWAMGTFDIRQLAAALIASGYGATK